MGVKLIVRISSYEDRFEDSSDDYFYCLMNIGAYGVRCAQGFGHIINSEQRFAFKLTVNMECKINR